MEINGKQVAELLVTTGLKEVVLIVKLILKVLSFRLGTLLLCGFMCFDWNWPFMHKFSEISLEKREEILKKWSRETFFMPLRIVFIAVKIFSLYVFFSRVMIILFVDCGFRSQIIITHKLKK